MILAVVGCSVGEGTGPLERYTDTLIVASKAKIRTVECGMYGGESGAGWCLIAGVGNGLPAFAAGLDLVGRSPTIVAAPSCLDRPEFGVADGSGRRPAMGVAVFTAGAGLPASTESVVLDGGYLSSVSGEGCLELRSAATPG